MYTVFNCNQFGYIIGYTAYFYEPSTDLYHLNIAHSMNMTAIKNNINGWDPEVSKEKFTRWPAGVSTDSSL